jgi:hypothetical protein
MGCPSSRSKRGSEGTVDLTGANHFLRVGGATAPDLRAELVNHIRELSGDQMCNVRGNPLFLFAVVRILLNALAAMHSAWCTKQTLTPLQVVAYPTQVDNFRSAWEALT